MKADELQSLVETYAKKHGVDPELAMRIVMAESGGNPDAVSPKGAQGLMQLMPATAKELGVKNPFDPKQNLDAGLKYLSQLVDEFGSNRKALAAYNFGRGNVAAGKALPKETTDYLSRILGPVPQVSMGGGENIPPVPDHVGPSYEEITRDPDFLKFDQPAQERVLTKLVGKWAADSWKQAKSNGSVLTQGSPEPSTPSEAFDRVMEAVGLGRGDRTTPTLGEKPLNETDAAAIITGLGRTFATAAAPAMMGMSIPQLISTLALGAGGAKAGKYGGRKVGEYAGAPETGAAVGENAVALAGAGAGNRLMTALVGLRGPAPLVAPGRPIPEPISALARQIAAERMALAERGAVRGKFPVAAEPTEVPPSSQRLIQTPQEVAVEGQASRPAIPGPAAAPTTGAVTLPGPQIVEPGTIEGRPVPLTGAAPTMPADEQASRDFLAAIAKEVIARKEAARTAAEAAPSALNLGARKAIAEGLSPAPTPPESAPENTTSQAETLLKLVDSVPGLKQSPQLAQAVAEAEAAVAAAPRGKKLTPTPAAPYNKGVPAKPEEVTGLYAVGSDAKSGFVKKLGATTDPAEAEKILNGLEDRGKFPEGMDAMLYLPDGRVVMYSSSTDAANVKAGHPGWDDVGSDMYVPMRQQIVDVLGKKPSKPAPMTPNASGESAASAEAISRQAGMRAKGEQYVVYDRAGKKRPLIGPDAVDYVAQKGETYGIDGPSGFRVLDNKGGKYPGKVVGGGQVLGYSPPPSPTAGVEIKNRTEVHGSPQAASGKPPVSEPVQSALTPPPEGQRLSAHERGLRAAENAAKIRAESVVIGRRVYKIGETIEEGPHKGKVVESIGEGGVPVLAKPPTSRLNATATPLAHSTTTEAPVPEAQVTSPSRLKAKETDLEVGKKVAPIEASQKYRAQWLGREVTDSKGGKGTVESVNPNVVVVRWATGEVQPFPIGLFTEKFGASVQPKGVPGGKPTGGDGAAQPPKAEAGFEPVKDKEDKPLILYHGTSGTHTEYSPDKSGTSAIWLTTNSKDANHYAVMRADYAGGEPRVDQLHVQLKNPKVLPEHEGGPDITENEIKLFNKLKAEGHDGVIFGSRDNGDYVVFDPSKVRPVGAAQPPKGEAPTPVPSPQAVHPEKFMTTTGFPGRIGEGDRMINAPDLLKTVRVPEEMYHITSKKVLPQILKEGLRIGVKPVNTPEEFGSRVYLTPDSSLRPAFDIYVPDDAVVLAINTKGLKLRLDPEFFEGSTPKAAKEYIDAINRNEEIWALYSNESIPADRIRVLKEKPPRP